MFRDLDIWQKINDGRLTTYVKPKTYRSTSFPNAVSQMLQHRDAATNEYVCTTHRIVDKESGEPLHWDEEDLHLDGIVYVKGQSQV
jgi:hypothetical protein